MNPLAWLAIALLAEVFRERDRLEQRLEAWQASRAERARFLQLAREKQQRRDQRQRELSGGRDWRLGLARWVLWALEPGPDSLSAARHWLAGWVTDRIQAAYWFTGREMQRHRSRQDAYELRQARAAYRERLMIGQIVLLAGNDTITAYSLRGACLAGVLPCSLPSIRQYRKRYRAVFPEPVHRQGQTDYWFAAELERWWQQYGRSDARSVMPPTTREIEARFEALDSQPLVPVALADRVSAQLGRTNVPGPTRARVARNPAPQRPEDPPLPPRPSIRGLSDHEKRRVIREYYSSPEYRKAQQQRQLSRMLARERGELPRRPSIVGALGSD
jgi:hypothetical protein